MRCVSAVSILLMSAYKQFKATLAALYADLEDVDENVRVVEEEEMSDSPLLGVSYEETRHSPRCL